MTVVLMSNSSSIFYAHSHENGPLGHHWTFYCLKAQYETNYVTRKENSIHADIFQTALITISYNDIQ